MKPFTARIKPYEGESLSSFMLRFSKANGIKFLTLWNMIKKNATKYAQMSHIHLLNFTPINIIDYSKLATATGLNEADIFNLTLYNLLKKFSVNDNLDRSRFLLDMLTNDSFYYCPLCLKENPYHHLIWSIKEVTLCKKHGIYLINECYKCGRTIEQNHIIEIGKCPYCLSSITDTKQLSIGNNDEYRRQNLTYDSLCDLLKPKDIRIQPQLLALKIIYVLNGQNKVYNRETVCKNISDSQLVPTLLQHARGTLSQERTINLKFILSVLEEENISFKEFYELELPEEFVNSLLVKQPKYEEESFCKAPWCKNYNVKNSLFKIPTSYQKKYNGDFKSYYFICPECGCEYIYTKEGRIAERTNFVYAYNSLKNLEMSTKSLKDLSEFCNISKDRMLRFVAYFSSNNIFDPLDRYCSIHVNEILINKFIEEIEKGVGIEEIRHKKYWNDNYHYLIHRYNNKVIQAIAMNHLNRHKNPNIEGKMDLIKDVIDDLLKNNIKITIDAVCERLGIVHETIRLWRCNEIIQNIKKIQRSEK